MDTVSVIIPSFNRFNYVLNTIKSIKEQSYKVHEIIVVNDCSTQQEYYNYDWESLGVIIVHLKKNSKKMFRYPCAGFVRNQGIHIARGKYIAFCDDDDIWFPLKIELQLKKMKELDCRMSCTEGLFGYGQYDPTQQYPKYHGEHYFNIIKEKFGNLITDRFPDLITRKMVMIHNCITCSSVLIEKSLLTSINNFKTLKNAREDYDCWLRALKHTNCAYVNEICYYYDGGHGDGNNY